jgi:hypothetical protein
VRNASEITMIQILYLLLGLASFAALGALTNAVARWGGD